MPGELGQRIYTLQSCKCMSCLECREAKAVCSPRDLASHLLGLLTISAACVLHCSWRTRALFPPSLKLTLHRNLTCILTCAMTNWFQYSNKIPTWPARERGCLWLYQTAKVKINKIWKNKQEIKACIHFTKIPSQFIAVLRDYRWYPISSSVYGFLRWLCITNINCIEK